LKQSATLAINEKSTQLIRDGRKAFPELYCPNVVHAVEALDRWVQQQV